MTTTFATKQTVQHDWYHVDASEQILGRLAVKVARVLQGKNKAIYSPNVDCGDYVVVTGAENIRLSGTKELSKVYHHHTGYIGGMKYTPFLRLRATHPDQLFRNAVRRMIPKNQMGREMLAKLKVYAGSEHPHTAQNPQPLP